MLRHVPFLQKKISNREFGIMQGLYRLIDHVHPYIPASVALFGIKPGQTVIDYGCGPGRYTVEFARLVTGSGKVVAVDLVEIALQETQKKLEAGGFENYELVLARDYDSGIADNTADAVFAIDMFHHIADTDAFLQELHRIAKPDALLLFSGGHMLRKTLKKKVDHSGLWKLTEERREFITYKPKEPA